MSGADEQKRVQFDFTVEFLNGGSLEGRDFRLDVAGDAVSDQELADAVVRDLRLLMVGAVRISNKRLLTEPHKRGDVAAAAPGGETGGEASGQDRPRERLVDLSHTVEHGMVTYKGLPAPIICDYLSREQSRALYAPGTEFHIGKIEMVANTGTYLDSPFHRFADGKDLSALDLPAVAELEGIVVRVTGMQGRTIGRAALMPYDVRGKAVLVHTGWDAHWRTDQYFEGHPFLTADAAAYLVASGAALVDLDSMNIDDIGYGARPVHTALLGAGIPIVEHLRGLEQLPIAGFRFTAAPVKVKGFGTFPVRAYAHIPQS